MAEFAQAHVATVKMNVNATTGGVIAQSDDAVTSSRIMSFQGIKADATLAQAKTVVDAFMDVVGGEADELSAKKIITQGVTADG